MPVNYDRFHLQLRAGVRIYADDGTLSFVVEAVRGQDVHVVAETAGTLKSRKGINVPEVDLGQQLVTPRDREMVAFAKHAGVDFVGISFVESAAHVAAIRALIDARRHASSRRSRIRAASITSTKSPGRRMSS